MAYRLRKPPTGESSDHRIEGEAEPAGPQPPQPSPTPPSQSAEPDPERRNAVVAAFSAFFSDLEPLLGERWTGAWNRLKTLAPPLASAIDDAEAAADRMALDHMNGRASWAEFEAAIDQYARAWKNAADVLRDADLRTDDRRCTDCGRGDLTVLVLDDQGNPFCRECLKGRS